MFHSPCASTRGHTQRIKNVDGRQSNSRSFESSSIRNPEPQHRGVKGMTLMLEALLCGPQAGRSGFNPKGGTMVGIQIPPDVEKVFVPTEEVAVTTNNAKNIFGNSLEITMQVMLVIGLERGPMQPPFPQDRSEHCVPSQPTKGGTGQTHALWNPIKDHHMHICSPDCRSGLLGSFGKQTAVVRLPSTTKTRRSAEMLTRWSHFWMSLWRPGSTP